MARYCISVTTSCVTPKGTIRSIDFDSSLTVIQLKLDMYVETYLVKKLWHHFEMTSTGNT